MKMTPHAMYEFFLLPLPEEPITYKNKTTNKETADLQQGL